MGGGVFGAWAPRNGVQATGAGAVGARGEAGSERWGSGLLWQEVCVGGRPEEESGGRSRVGQPAPWHRGPRQGSPLSGSLSPAEDGARVCRAVRGAQCRDAPAGPGSASEAGPACSTESRSAASREPRARRAGFPSHAEDPAGAGGPSWAAWAARKAPPSARPSLPVRRVVPAEPPPPPGAESILIPRLGPGGPEAASEAH